MKEIIETLVEIETKAQSIIDNASSEKKTIAVHMSDELGKYEQEVKRRNDEKIKELAIKTESEIEPEKQKLYESGNQFLSEIENNFFNNHSQMADDIVKQIVG